MLSAPTTENEVERLRALQRLDILDTLEEQAYDDLTYLAAQICDTPIALVSLIDKDRQWFKSHLGLPVRETPREYAFCAHAIHGTETFLVEDSDQDPRFHDNPLVTGEPHVKFYAGVPLYIEKKYPIGTLCVIDDHARTLTDQQKKALEALSRQVVSQLELRMKVKELKSLDKAKDDFISMVSHELRTPLTSITGSLSLLVNTMSDQLETKAAMMADIAYRNSERVLLIVNDILDIARIEAGKMELRMASHNVTELMRESVELNLPYANKCFCQIELQLKHGDENLEIDVDKLRFIQIMSNLISNAAKFAGENDTLLVRTVINKKSLRISVIDHGVGIADDMRPDIFKRFSQPVANFNHKLPGTGLGLNLCKALIEKHGGVIDFNSTVDVGSEFFFDLPL